MKKVYMYILLIITLLWNVCNAARAGFQMYQYGNAMAAVNSSIALGQLRRMMMLCGGLIGVNLTLVILGVIGLFILGEMKQ